MLFEWKHWCLGFCILEMGIKSCPASVFLSEQWREATDSTIPDSDTPRVQEDSEGHAYHWASAHMPPGPRHWAILLNEMPATEHGGGRGRRCGFTGSNTPLPREGNPGVQLPQLPPCLRTQPLVGCPPMTPKGTLWFRTALPWVLWTWKSCLPRGRVCGVEWEAVPEKEERKCAPL